MFLGKNTKPKKTIDNRGSRKDKPVKPKTDLEDISDFINNELKKVKGMSSKQTNQPKVNVIKEKEKKELRESINLKKLNQLPQNNPAKEQEPLNTTATKFEGFSKATKFNNNPSQIIDNNKNELLRPLSSTSKNSSLSKPEPFVIKKFPEQSKQQLLHDMSKEKLTPLKMEIKPNEMSVSKKDENEMKQDMKGKKKYEMKVEKKEEEEEEEYGNDFIEDEIDEDIDEFNRNGEEYVNVDDEYLYRREQERLKKQKPKTKREITLERLRDLKGVVEIATENINFFSLDVNKNNNQKKNVNKKITMDKEDACVNTEKIKTKDKGTSMENAVEVNKNSTSSKHINNNRYDEYKQEVESNEENKENKDNTNDTTNNNNKEENIIMNYQPLTYEAYKFFVHIGPYIENVLLNNINKYILQSKGVVQESTGFSKVSKDFIFPEELLLYVYPDASTTKTKISFNKFLFFDTKPFLIAFSISITPKTNSNNVSLIIPNNENNSFQSIHLIILYSTYKMQIDKIFFSFSQITDMALIGESENILIASRSDGLFSAYDIYNIFNIEQYYLNFESDNKLSIARMQLNNTTTKTSNQPKFQLVLPFASSDNCAFSYLLAPIKKIIKCIDERQNEKVFTVYAIDYNCTLYSFIIRESYTHNNNSNIVQCLEHPEIHYDLSSLIQRAFNKDEPLRCYDIKHYMNNIFILLTNVGLCSIEIEGKESYIINPLYSNQSEVNHMTTFDISETGHIVCGFNDHSIIIIDMNNSYDIIYTSYVSNIPHSSHINKIVWSNVICKNSKGKLIRKHLLANFFVFTTKNDFIIFDLNQKKTEEIRKVKKKKEMGSKQHLTRRNSLIDMSDVLFTDYSNLILLSNSNEDNTARVELHKLILRKQYFDESNIERANEKILQKVFSLNNKTT